MIDRNGCDINPGDCRRDLRFELAKLESRPASIVQLNTLEVRPDVIVENKLSQRRHNLASGVDNDRRLKSRERFRDVSRKRSNVVVVRVSDDEMPEAANLVRRKRKADAPGIDAKAVV